MRKPEGLLTFFLSEMRENGSETYMGRCRYVERPVIETDVDCLDVTLRPEPLQHGHVQMHWKLWSTHI